MCCISSWYRFISPVNMLVLIWKPFGNGRWWLLVLWPESGWIKYAWFDLTFHRVQELCKSRGDLDFLDGLVRVWSNASESGSKPIYRNHWAWFLAGRKWPSTSFPVRQSCILSQTSWIILYKTSCVGVWAKWIWSKSKAVCENHQKLRLANTSELIRTGCEMHLAHLDLLGWCYAVHEQLKI